MANELKQVMAKLDRIHAEVHELRVHALNPDAMADEDDIQAIVDAREARRTDHLEPLGAVRKRLKL